METYFTFKLICEYYIPLAFLALCGIVYIGLVIAGKILDFSDKKEKKE